MPDFGNASIFSQTDASNNSGTMPGWNGSFAPSTLDNAGRGLQGAIARQWYWSNYTLTSTGSGAAYVLTYAVAPAALYDGQTFKFKASAASTGAATLNINAIGALAIKRDANGTLVDIIADDIAIGQYVEVSYNGSVFVWTNWRTPAAASETVKGIVELATTAEAAALVDTTRATTPAGLAAATTGKKAVWIDASAMRPKATNGAGFSDYDSGTNDLTLRCADFDTTTQEYVHFKMAMPDIWNEGTVTFKPYWTNTAGLTTETVVFSLAGAAFSNDDGINGTAFGTVQTSTDTWLAQNDLHVGPESAAITIAGTPAAGDLVVFEVSRVVASDNLTGDARLIGIMLYVTTNALNEP